MSKFICHNSQCPKCGEVEEIFSNSYHLVNGKFQSNNAPCPHCGQIREEISDNTPLSQKNISLGTFTMASPEQKKEMLKKRSHEHYEKEIKPMKEHQLNEAMNQFRDMTKK